MGVTFNAEILTEDGWVSPDEVAPGTPIGYVDDINRLAWKPIPTLRRVEKAPMVRVQHRSWYNYLDYQVAPGTYIPVLQKKPSGRPRRVPAADIYDAQKDGRGGMNLRWYHLFSLKGAADTGRRPHVVDWYIRNGVTGGLGSTEVDIKQVRGYSGYIEVMPPPAEFKSLASLVDRRPRGYRQYVEVPPKPGKLFRLTEWDAARLVEVAAQCEVSSQRLLDQSTRKKSGINPITTYYNSHCPDLLQLAHILVGLGSTVEGGTITTAVTGRVGALVGLGTEVNLVEEDAWWIDEPRPLLRRNGRVLIL